MKKQLIILGLVFWAVLSVISLTQAEVLIERGSEWKYFKGTEQPVSAKYSWWDTRFTDSTWANSRALFVMEMVKAGRCFATCNGVIHRSFLDEHLRPRILLLFRFST